MACADPQARHQIVIALADLIHELSGVEATILRERQRLFAHHKTHAANITQVREEVAMDLADKEADVVELKADIEELRLRLQHHDHTCESERD